MATMPMTSHPSLRRASTAFRLLWPVDTRSSTTTTFWLGLRSPSITFSNPWSLGLNVHTRKVCRALLLPAHLELWRLWPPAITSTSSYFSAMMLAICILMKVRISGYDNVLRLSQYMGDFQPDAQVNGFSGLYFYSFYFQQLFCYQSFQLFHFLMVLCLRKFTKFCTILNVCADIFGESGFFWVGTHRLSDATAG